MGMDTSSEFERVKAKQKVGAPVSAREVAVIYANDDRSLLDFLVENDYVQVYSLLHQSDATMEIGKNANFVPDRSRVVGELNSLLVKKDFSILNDIIRNFRINMAAGNKTSNPKVIESLSDIGAISMTDTGYKFNLSLS